MDVKNSQLLRLKEVLDIVGFGRSTLYVLVATGNFPAPVRIGRRAVAWRARDVSAWIEARPQTRTGSARNEVE